MIFKNINYDNPPSGASLSDLFPIYSVNQNSNAQESKIDTLYRQASQIQDNIKDTLGIAYSKDNLEGIKSISDDSYNKQLQQFTDTYGDSITKYNLNPEGAMALWYALGNPDNGVNFASLASMSNGPAASNETSTTPQEKYWTQDQLDKKPYFRNNHLSSKRTVTIDDKTYPIKVTTNLYPAEGGGIENDITYAYDPEQRAFRRVTEFLGNPKDRFADGSQWIPQSEFDEAYQTVQGKIDARRRAPVVVSPTTGTIYYNFKNGGIMNKTNYYQQGGAMTQDVKAQVVQLVQAAMSGDEKATKQVSQIMEAAKQGNPQAVQIAELISQVAQELQKAQAPAARMGAKLNYIKSLKYAKGGRARVARKRVCENKCGGKAEK